MPVRALLMAALLAVTSAFPCLAGADDSVFGPPLPPPYATSDSPDSNTTDPAAVLSRAKVAYDQAWQLRRSGDAAGAVQVLDAALTDMHAALKGNPDLSLRQLLNDLQSRMSGLRDEAAHDLANGGKAAADSSDAPVLDQPAADVIQPQMNADVYRYIEFFTGAGRSTFERWLKRSGRYMDLFREVLRREGLPSDLVHLVFVESGFNLNARSVSAAVGPWQFLRSTARLWGLTVNQWVDERRDPEKSTVAAARYLKHLYSVFGDWPLVLASYNAGEGTILRAIKAQGTTNYWDLRLPRQTEEYVPQFMAVLAITRDPQKYGFDQLELDEPMDFDELALKGTVDLRQIARLAGCSIEDLKTLNPALLRHAAPPRDGVTTIRVPRGKAEAVLREIGDGSVSMPAVDLTVRHRVTRGETLNSIAAQYGVDPATLARQNGVSRHHPLTRGMTLTVRAGAKTGRLQAADLEPNDPRRSTAYVPPRTVRPPAQLSGHSEADGRATITVHKGETLSMIATRYDVDVDDLRSWNRLKTDHLHRGQRLKVRTGDAATPTPEMAAADSATAAGLPTLPSRRHHRGSHYVADDGTHRVVTVRSGDTLGGIARENGVSVSRIKEMNGLGSNLIRAGQRLRLPA
ncbi:MAG: LysM peptidoglycan-binding domain-containing protein [Candidatus Eisenbacteria bacterium]